MTKIVYNACYGGSSLSDKAILRYAELKGFEKSFTPITILRTDPILIQVIEELGVEANGAHADLFIRELPPGTKYFIYEYDGKEQVVTMDEHHWLVA